jgi:hypothetical protein
VLIRDSGLTVANDLILALLAVVASLAVARRRPALAAVAVGAAISVKPAAAVLLPLLFVSLGWRRAVTALVVPVLIQVPFFLWPNVGLHGIGAIAEPLGRDAPYAVLRTSTWWPYFATFGYGASLVKVAAAANLAIACAVSGWAGWRLRGAAHPPPLTAVAACFALPLFASYALAPVPHLNYGGWYLGALALAIGATADGHRHAVDGPVR